MGEAHDKNGQYFAEDPTVPSRVVTYTIEGPRGPLTIASDAGVFSHGSLDKATAVLLERLGKTQDTFPEGDFVDVGCGAGPIAVLLAAMFPHRKVWAVDTNSRAVDLCRTNARANSLANITACSPDEVPAGTVMALVCSNPPIRVGKDALHAILAVWLGRLHPRGEALLVVGKNLGADSLQTWLASNGWPTERLSSSKGFRVFRSVVRDAGG